MSNIKSSKIGIFGGTFNPPHIAHTTIALTFIEVLNLSKCIFIPAFKSPFKSEYFDSDIDNITPRDRLNMTELATRSNSKFEVSDFEIKRSDISYTIDTVMYFQKKYPEMKLFLLIGEDQAVEFHRWKQAREILRYVTVCVAARISEKNLDNKIIQFFKDSNSELILIPSPIIEISSSMIRERIRLGLSIKEFVSPEVEEYIYKNNLYKS